MILVLYQNHFFDFIDIFDYDMQIESEMILDMNIMDLVRKKYRFFCLYDIINTFKKVKICIL